MSLAAIAATSVGAGADSATPASVSGSAIINATGSVTVTVHGTWSWTNPDDGGTATYPCTSGEYGSHDDDYYHYAVGWAMLWNDATDPGVNVTIHHQTYSIGSTNTSNGNVVDNTIHTYTDQFEGTVSTTGTTGQVTGVPAGFASLISTGMSIYGFKIPTGTTITAITSGATLTLTLSNKVYGSASHDHLAVDSGTKPPSIPVYNNGPDTLTGGKGVATGTTGTSYDGTFQTCGAETGTASVHGHTVPVVTGTWGPESHTYKNATTVPSKICVNLYDVHGMMGGSWANDYTVTRNEDNSISTNDFTATESGYCYDPQITPTVRTTPSVGTNGTVPVGGAGVTDTAVVSGSGEKSPHGSVTFSVCGPLDGATGCTSTAETVDVLGTVTTPTSTTGVSSTFKSASFSPTTVGTYCFLATFTPTDDTTLFTTGSDGSGARECFKASHVVPGFTTNLVQPTSPVVGHSWNDSATVTGTASGGSPSGPVTFTFCQETSGPCTGGTTVATVTTPTSTTSTNHSATYTLPAGDAKTPTSVGSYCYNASFAGDANYASVSSETNGPECFTVTAATSHSTTGAGSGSTTTQPSITGATTVHTGEPWAGSRILELFAAAAGLGLLALGEVVRRRYRRNLRNSSGS